MTELEASRRIRVPKSRFAAFLRSGQLGASGSGIEFKFNPWHDPRTGRFTFKGGGNGTWGGGGFTGGGGGSFNGGGATGTFSWPAKDAPGKNTSPAPAARGSTKTSIVQKIATAASSPAGTTVTRNGYTYQIDNNGRTTQVNGELTLNPDQARSRSAQANAGGTDRLPTDDGGHYVAARFNGPTDSFNHFAQDANFNRGGYRVLENQWATDVKRGDAVWVKIVPSYSGSSLRPREINVTFSVNGSPGRRSFSNSSSKGK